mmetsp:Transcript_64943/g.174350  ORF Transcript_64943/g.174350 Transcript_64943/m.174350 type:complete len:281 (+) Transcript_64943:97-939(+)
MHGHILNSPADVSAQALQRARRIATRKKAVAACLMCKSRRGKCSGYRPCARCCSMGRADECWFPEARSETEPEGAAATRQPNQHSQPVEHELASNTQDPDWVSSAFGTASTSEYFCAAPTIPDARCAAAAQRFGTAATLDRLHDCADDWAMEPRFNQADALPRLNSLGSSPPARFRAADKPPATRPQSTGMDWTFGAPFPIEPDLGTPLPPPGLPYHAPAATANTPFLHALASSSQHAASASQPPTSSSQPAGSDWGPAARLPEWDTADPFWPGWMPGAQ